MKTVLAVAKHEFLLLLRDRRVLLCGLAFWLLLSLTLGVSQSQYLSRQKRLESAAKVSRNQWLSNGSANPHALAHYGIDIYRRASPFSLLHPGAQPYVGVTAHITAHLRANLVYRPIADRPSLARWADVSTATLLQIVVPLLLVLLTFAAIAGEREEGRWAFLLGQGTSATALALGKILGVIAVSFCLLAPCAAVIVSMLRNTAWAVGDYQEFAARLLVIFSGYGAAYLFFLTLGIAISALSATRQTALLVLLGCWAFFCLVTPRVVTAYAEKRFPIPSQDELELKVNEGMRDYKAMGKFTDARVAQAMRLYQVEDEKALPFNTEGLKLQAGEEYASSIEDRHRQPLWAQFKAQERWMARWGGVLTPAVTLRSLAETTSGTDAPTLRGQALAMENYRRDWVRRLNEAIMHAPRRPRRRRGAQNSPANAASSNLAARNRRSSPYGAQLWASIPEFQAHTPGLASLSSQLQLQLAVLWGWAALGLAGAVCAVRFKCGANHAL